MVLKIDQVFNFPTALRKGLSSKHKTRTPVRFCKYVWDSVSYSIPASSWDCIEFIYCQHYPATGVVISKTLPLWNEEWQYTSSSRNGLENTPPRQFAPSAPEIALGQTLGPTTKLCNKITGIVNKRLIVFCISDLFEVIHNVRHVKDTTRILQFLAQTGAKCAPYCVWAVFGRVALGSHGVEWTCDLQFQFYKRWFSIERNMSQQTLIIVFFILLVDIFVNEAVAVF